jgi:hypothetical protein
MALPSLPKIDPNALMATANQQAQGIYSPILAQINAQYQRERDAAIARQQQMAQATDQAYASARDPMANLWNSAIQQGTELENAVSNRLKGIGDTRGTDFAARLAQMGAPQTGAAQELATTYKGADAAGFAKGMNDVGRLVSRGAEARSFLEKQPGIARQQSQKELAEALREMFESYSDNTGELMANLPGQVQSIYDKLYGQRTDEREAQNTNAWKQVQFIQEQIQANQEAKIVAAQLGDKKAARAAQARQKALDRELQMWKAQLQAETDAATPSKPSAKSSAANRKFNPDGSPNPNYTPPTAAKDSGGGVTAAQKRLRQNQAKADIRRELLNPDTQQLRQGWKNQPRGKIEAAINAILKDNGISTNSPEGRSIRRSFTLRVGKRKANT